MSKSRKSQPRYVGKVKEITKEYERKGYMVKADVRGYSRPDAIGGLRPDIIATKGNQKVIIEVKQTDTVYSAREDKRLEAFRTAAKKSRDTKYKRYVVDVIKSLPVHGAISKDRIKKAVKSVSARSKSS